MDAAEPAKAEPRRRGRGSPADLERVESRHARRRVWTELAFERVPLSAPASEILTRDASPFDGAGDVDVAGTARPSQRVLA